MMPRFMDGCGRNLHHEETSQIITHAKAMRALTDAVAKAVEEHRRRGIPLAIGRNGRAVSIPATEASALRENPMPYHTKSHGA